jgi:cytochrome c2
LTTPLAAWSIHAAALWIWHLPGPYQSTLSSGTMHFLQHASFLGSALLFWWALLHGREGVMGYGTAVLYVFTTMLHTGLLGALLTFSPTVWYPAYYATTAPWGLTALEDQQLGGLIMWIPAGLIYIVAALALMARLLRHSELQMRRGARAAGVALLIAGSSVLLAGCQPEPADAGDAAIALTGGDPERGKAEIRRFGCGSCHVIPGVRGAEGMVGPPLAGIANRMYLGGVLTNTPEHMMRWIMTPKEVDSLTVMPNLGVDAVQARHIAAYLYTLR